MAGMISLSQEPSVYTLRFVPSGPGRGIRLAFDIFYGVIVALPVLITLDAILPWRSGGFVLAAIPVVALLIVYIVAVVRKVPPVPLTSVFFSDGRVRVAETAWDGGAAVQEIASGTMDDLSVETRHQRTARTDILWLMLRGGRLVMLAREEGVGDHAEALLAAAETIRSWIAQPQPAIGEHGRQHF